MIAIGYMFIAFAAAACLVFAAKAYIKQPNNILLLILCPTSLLWFDSFIIAMGQSIGEGSLLLIATYIRYSAHWLMLPLLFIAAGLILRGADFKFASNKYVMGVFYLLAAFFIVEDFRHIFIVDFYPACYGDTLRYVTQVPIGQACTPEMEGVGMRVSPAAAILLTLILLVSGIAIWIKHKWPWLALGCFVMFLAAQPTAIGPILSNAGEPVFTFVVTLAAIKFGNRSQEQALPNS
ncbi:MAG: hypothetical protein MK201_03565 [Gammaproteobacteria bacterium]|jgi:hypothetical protein|nr:hypothetical protein [Gammaproteobacteria bacterium]|tara:strand:- start:1136 stop:1843 length:708 start_codon:yes stop_codon:yes gene_type:complete